MTIPEFITVAASSFVIGYATCRAMLVNKALRADLAELLVGLHGQLESARAVIAQSQRVVRTVGELSAKVGRLARVLEGESPSISDEEYERRLREIKSLQDSVEHLPDSERKAP